MAAASSSSSLDPKTLNPSSTNPPPTSSSQSPQPLFPSLLSTPKPPTSSSSTPSPQIPKTQDPMGGYPLASSGRGFVPPKSFRPDQLVTVANSGAGFPPRSAAPPQFSNQVRSFGFPNQTPSSMRPPFSSVFKPRPPMVSSATASGPMKSNSPAVLHANNKNATFQSPAPGNGYRDPRDTNRDDMVVTINHRKVRLSDGTSLYALCRSWVRNGMPKETQPQFGEGLKLLPRPLPVNAANTHIPESNGSGDEVEEKEEDASAVENLSARELLQRHVKRAKKVRARLRKERLQRIERYKQRLALLLPSPVEQFRNDATTET